MIAIDIALLIIASVGLGIVLYREWQRTHRHRR